MKKKLKAVLFDMDGVLLIPCPTTPKPGIK